MVLSATPVPERSNLPVPAATRAHLPGKERRGPEPSPRWSAGSRRRRRGCCCWRSLPAWRQSVAKNVAVGVSAVTMDTVSLNPGGVMGPETVWMTPMRLAVLLGPVDQVSSCVLLRGPASLAPGCVTRIRIVPTARTNSKIALGPRAQVSS